MTEQQSTEPEVEETEETPEAPVDEGTDADNGPESDTDDEPETFDREYVEKLRKEAAEHRVKAKKADAWGRELFHARVAATGRLADADDLPYDEALLDDHDALAAAVEELVTRKPHLASRTPRGDVGQGASSNDGTSVDLAGILRSRA